MRKKRIKVGSILLLFLSTTPSPFLSLSNKKERSPLLIHQVVKRPTLTKLLEEYQPEALTFNMVMDGDNSKKISLNAYLELLTLQLGDKNLCDMILTEPADEIYKRCFLLSCPLLPRQVKSYDKPIALQVIDEELQKAVVLFFNKIESYLNQSCLDSTYLDLFLKKKLYIDQYKGLNHLFSIGLNFHMLLHHKRLKESQQMRYFNFLSIFHNSFFLGYFYNQATVNTPLYILFYLIAQYFDKKEVLPQSLLDFIDNFDKRWLVKSSLIWIKFICFGRGLNPVSLKEFGLKSVIDKTKKTWFMRNNNFYPFYKGLELLAELTYYPLFTSSSLTTIKNQHILRTARRVVALAKKQKTKIEKRSKELSLVVDALKEGEMLQKKQFCDTSWGKKLVIEKDVYNLILAYTYKEGVDYQPCKDKKKICFFSVEKERKLLHDFIGPEPKTYNTNLISRSFIALFSLFIGYSCYKKLNG